MNTYTKIFVLFTFLSGLTACQEKSNTFSNIEHNKILTGKNMADELCSSCHATGTIGNSPRTDAPPLRSILENYNAESLGDDFREHIHVGHPDMPDFEFNVKETDAILAYLKSIQE